MIQVIQFARREGGEATRHDTTMRGGKEYLGLSTSAPAWVPSNTVVIYPI